MLQELDVTLEQAILTDLVQVLRAGSLGTNLGGIARLWLNKRVPCAVHTPNSCRTMHGNGYMLTLPPRKRSFSAALG